MYYMQINKNYVHQVGDQPRLRLSLFCIPEILHPFIGTPARNKFAMLNNLPRTLLLDNYIKFHGIHVFVNRLYSYANHLYLEIIKSQRFELRVA
jgi:hypothetical protein